jgi:UbiD family decarboxylase
MASLRAFVTTLESRGELERVSAQVDWRYEVWDRTRDAQSRRGGGPALLFTSVRDYPGHQILTNGLGRFERIALALGLDPRIRYGELLRTFRERARILIPPVHGAQRRADEIVLRGEDVDLEALPVPWLHRTDAGRYVGTWHINVSRDPQTGGPNVGVYRMQLLGKRRTTLSLSPRSHLRRHLGEAAARGTSLEMAVAIGVDETQVIAAASCPAFGVDEFALAGGLAGQPVRLARCVGIDLEVPADAEIVLEGHVDPARTAVDGPFFDYAGIANTNRLAFVFDVSAVRVRTPALFRASAIGYPGAEDHVLSTLLAGAGLLDFHGSGVRQAVQNSLLRRRWYRLFQLSGRISQRTHRSGKGTSSKSGGAASQDQAEV